MGVGDKGDQGVNRWRRVGAGVQRGGRPLPKSRKRGDLLRRRDMCANEKERGHRRRRSSVINSHDGVRLKCINNIHIHTLYIYICKRNGVRGRDYYRTCARVSCARGRPLLRRGHLHPGRAVPERFH